MMLGARKLWDLIDHFMSVIQSETDFPVLIYDTDGYIIRATEADRIGDLHAGAEMIMQAQVEEYAVTAEEAALNPLIREGFSCPIIMDGQIVAGFGITGKLALAKPVAKIAVKIIEAWIQSQDYQIQLERSERNYRDIFDHSLHGIYQATMEGQFLAANVAMAKILGYLSPEALIAEVKSFSRQLYAEPEDRDRFLAAIKAHGEVSDFETRFMRRDGKIVDIRINSRIKHDPESDLPVIEGLMEDITERKMAESAIRQSEEKFTKVFHNSPVCVVLSAMSSGRYIEVNETFLRTMGYTRDEVIGRTSLAMRTWIDPRDRAAMAGTLNSEGRVRNLEVKRRTKTGETLTMLFSADRIEISGKTCLLSVSQDITGRKRMEGRLRDSETHLKTVLDSVEDAVIAIDRDGTITRMNRQAEMLTGWTCLEADGQHINAVVRIVDLKTRTRVNIAVAEVIESGRMAGLDDRNTLISKQGVESLITGSATPLLATDGAISGVVLVLRDVTASSENQRQLELARFSMEQAKTAVFWADPEGRFLYANQTAREWLQYSTAELLEMSVADINPEFPQHAWPAHWEEIKAHGMVRMESVHQRKNGEIYPVEIYSNYVKYEGREYKLAFVYDISERVRTAAALQQRLIQLQSIYNSLPVIIWSLDKDGVFTLSEGKDLASLGLEAGQMVGVSAYEVYKDNPLILEQIKKNLNGEFCEYESEVEGNNYHSFLTPIFDENNEVRGMNGLAINVTDKKRAEEELHRLRNYLSNILDSMPSVLIGVDAELSVTLWNSAAQRETGVAVEKALGQPLDRAFPRLAIEMDRVRKAIRTRQVRSNSRQAIIRSGENRYEDVVIYPLTANGAEGAVIRVDDVTERVRIEEMMVQSEKMLSVGGLAAGMAHEINNPLAGLMQTANVMSNRLSDMTMPGNAKAARALGTTLDVINAYMEARGIFSMLARIQESGERVAQIVANMLSFARKSDTVSSTSDLAELLDRSVELAASDYDLKKKYDFRLIEIVRDYESNLPPVRCEAGKIQQVLLNILRNGAEAMQAEKTHSKDAGQPRFNLRVRHQAADNMVCVEIEDNGPGMDSETRKRVFEPFFTTKPNDRGTGLGLSVSYFIITENHGGQMRVVSEPGKGTTFIVKLPLEARAA